MPLNTFWYCAADSGGGGGGGVDGVGDVVGGALTGVSPEQPVTTKPMTTTATAGTRDEILIGNKSGRRRPGRSGSRQLPAAGIRGWPGGTRRRR
ncbi:hypothetical protein GCM10028799_15970 [Kribbella italica]